MFKWIKINFKKITAYKFVEIIQLTNGRAARPKLSHGAHYSNEKHRLHCDSSVSSISISLDSRTNWTCGPLIDIWWSSLTQKNIDLLNLNIKIKTKFGEIFKIKEGVCTDFRLVVCCLSLIRFIFGLRSHSPQLT